MNLITVWIYQLGENLRFLRKNIFKGQVLKKAVRYYKTQHQYFRRAYLVWRYIAMDRLLILPAQSISII